jgi:hypothetical protein
MHDTLSSIVKGYIDGNNNINFIKGWAFILSPTLSSAPIRLSVNQTHFFEASVDERKDVSNFYKRNVDQCGFSISYDLTSLNENTIQREIQIKIEEEWVPIFRFAEITQGLFSFHHPNYSLVVVDNFYLEPDKVREFALKQNLIEHPNYHKGKRTETSYAPQGIKKEFERILGKKVTGWESYFPTNGCFQVCKTGDPLVYHSDTQKYAGIIYLTPNAPPGCGTSFYRSKHTLRMKWAPNEYGIVFPNGHLDPTDFEMVDTVGNVYNRLVLFDAKMLHAATNYFGDSNENCRLFQMFFFDIED